MDERDQQIMKQTIFDMAGLLEDIRDVHKKSSKVLYKTGFILDNDWTVLDIRNGAVVKELSIVADNNFQIFIKVDGDQYLGTHLTWDDLTAISLYSEYITAREESPSYIVNIADIHCKKSIEIIIHVTENTKINRLFMIYELI